MICAAAFRNQIAIKSILRVFFQGLVLDLQAIQFLSIFHLGHILCPFLLKASRELQYCHIVRPFTNIKKETHGAKNNVRIKALTSNIFSLYIEI